MGAYGDGGTSVEIYRRHAASVWAMARNVLGSSSDGDDVVADVFLALCRRPETFDPARGSLLTFLRLKARGRSIDIVRSEGFRRARGHAVLRGEIVTFPPVDSVLVAREGVQALRTAVASLPERERVVIQLVIFAI